MAVLSIPDQEEMVRNFIEITGCAIQEEAMDTLSRNIWNLDMAVSNYFTKHPPDESSPNQVEEAHDTPPSTLRRRTNQSQSSRNRHQEARLPHETAQEGDIEIVRQLYVLITNFIHSTLGVFAEASDDIPPETAAERLVQHMEEELGESHANFVTDTYESALHKALFYRKPLLVYLHSSDHPDTAAFCRKVFRDQRIQHLTQDRLLLWAGDVNYEDGYRAAMSLKASTFPFLALLFVEGTVRNLKIRLHARIEGPVGRTALADQLDDLCDRLDAQVVAQDVQRNEAFERQRLREEQDFALEQSLREDRRKEREREEKRREEEERVRLEKEAAEQREESLEQKRAAVQNEPEKSKDTGEIRIKLPHGTPVARRFLRTDKLSLLFDYLDIHIADNGLEIERYNLNTNFPRRSYSREEDGQLTIEEADFFPRAALFLQDLDA